MRTDVTVVPVDSDNWRAAVAVQVPDEQLAFVAAHQPVALLILAKAYLRLRERRWTPLAITTTADGVVGVVALADRDGTCEVLHLVVDAEHQGAGIATAAMAAISTFARTALGCRRLELTVHPDNVVAQRLYTSAGYRPTGAHRHDEPVWSRDVSLD